MNVKFSKHAVQRLRERFPRAIVSLVQIIERGLFNGWASPLPNEQWSLEGTIGHRPVRVVVADAKGGVVTVITAYWVD